MDACQPGSICATLDNRQTDAIKKGTDNTVPFSNSLYST
jgi:hypothetical protein